MGLVEALIVRCRMPKRKFQEQKETKLHFIIKIFSTKYIFSPASIFTREAIRCGVSSGGRISAFIAYGPYDTPFNSLTVILELEFFLSNNMLLKSG